jgi:hypothetical protein
MAKTFLTMYPEYSKRAFDGLVTCDETWVYFYSNIFNYYLGRNTELLKSSSLQRIPVFRRPGIQMF